MAPAQTLRFGQMLIELGDGATPVESFSRPCGLTSKQFSRKAQVGETNVPDCDDEDAPAHIERDTTGFTTDITGSGVVDAVDQATWEAWLASGAKKNVRVTIGTNVWIVPSVLTDFTFTGTRGQKLTFNVAIAGSGAPTKIA